MIENIDLHKTFNKNALIVFCAAVVLSILLVFKLFQLQVVDSKKYTTLSDKNRIRVYPVVQRRGRIISSDGKVIGKNRQRYRLSIEACPKDIFRKDLELVASQIYFSPEDLQKLYEIRSKTLRYTPIIAKDELSWDEYSKIAMIFYKLRHISVENSFIREYTAPIEFGHIIGYTSRSHNYLQSLKGEAGIEASMDERLIGAPGNVKMEINSIGKKMRIIDSVTPLDGEDVTITIDAEIQQYVYDLISQEKAGACVVIDIKDGSVVALVSVPGFDTNIMSSKIPKKRWNELLQDPLKPLINRATGGLYPPGSVFKIVTVLAALEKGIISPKDTINCTGGVVVDGHTFHCWRRSGHGRMNAYDALRFSCDCYIFEVARKLGINTIVEYAKKLGFGAKTGIEIPNENAGLLPSKQWKLLRYGSSWKPYETIITAIGQGALLATLIQSATMMGKIYSNNYDFKPTLIKLSEEEAKEKAEKIKRSANRINSENLAVIKDALYKVCNAGGTASQSCKTAYGISGKTGSSQVKKIKKGEEGMNQDALPWHLRDHAFFVGCAPCSVDREPRYVVAVMIEHGGGGAKKAAPIARKIFDKLMLSKKDSKEK